MKVKEWTNEVEAEIYQKFIEHPNNKNSDPRLFKSHEWEEKMIEDYKDKSGISIIFIPRKY